MNSNNQNIQDYCDLPMDQTGNSSASQQIFNNKNENIQHTLINNIQQQQLQHPVYQQNDIQQQSLDTTQSTSQVYSNNDTYSNTASILVNGTVSYSMQDGFQNSS
ncbi:hypothetical protein RhiirB3_453433 [Rhizophagus irregularis]|nr:hypothetical protein RhiirB3_453433 [Rhizophagus irregularis]